MSVESFAAARMLATTELGIPTEPWGAEDGQAFRIYEADPPEPQSVAGFEVQASPPWSRVGEPAILVDKATGEVTRVPMLADLERLTSMLPAGEGHPPEQLFDATQ